MAHLRLAIVTPRFWPLVGDGPTHLLRLAESLVSAGHSITIVTPQWKRSWPARMNIGRLPLVRLQGAPRGGWSTLRWMYTLSGWLREATSGALDGLLVAGLKQEAYVALGAARRTNIPTVLLAGEDDVAWHGTAALGSRIASRCQEARAIVATSNDLASEVSRRGFAADRITVIERTASIPPPRSPQARIDARAALAAVNYDLATTANTQVALAIGRLDVEHRFGDLVRAWRIVTARRPEARLWIVGDGPERERLYRQIGDLDQRFRALLPGTFDCLDELFQASDLLLAPAAHAAAPLTWLEAQATGLPIIAADAPAARRIITPQKSGLLCPPGDFKAVAAAVLALMDQPATAVEYGAEARQLAKSRPTPASEANQYVALFERLRTNA